MSKFKLTPRYVIVCFVAVIFNSFLHEFAHWLTGEFLGYKMGMSLNRTFLEEGSYVYSFHSTWVDAAGPIVTMILAFVYFYFLFEKYRSEIWYPFLFSAFYMRLLAAFLSFSNFNDEARVSKDVGMGAFLLPFIVCAILFLLVYWISVRNKYKIKFQLITALLVILYTALVYWADGYFDYQIF